MLNIKTLKVIRVVPRKRGIYVAAGYPGWRYEFQFFIRYCDGKVVGKTSDGKWVKLSKMASQLMHGKAYAYLREEPGAV